MRLLHKKYEKNIRNDELKGRRGMSDERNGETGKKNQRNDETVNWRNGETADQQRQKMEETK